MSTIVCGTGWGNTQPLPGDPDNSVVLSATPAFGGIDVSWTYPETNPHAVAHVLLFRSTSGTEGTEVLHKTVSGNSYYDKTVGTVDIEYFYWIEVVSINGTHGDRIGPVSAVARPTIEATMEGLTGRIDESVLAQSLKGEIHRIEDNALALAQEKLDRAAEDDQLGFAFNQVQAHSEESRAIIQEEKTARITADDAFAQQLNTVQTDLDGDIASVQTNLETNISHINGDLEEINASFSVVADVNGVIGGFGLFNDGEIVEAGFDVGRFWVGRTDSADGVAKGIKPFIIENDETFIKEAVIQSLTFNKLRNSAGSVVVENDKLKAANIEADQLEVEYGNIKNVSVSRADIQNAAINSAKIANAAITNAKIGTAAVDTLEIEGNAVTIPLSTNPSNFTPPTFGESADFDENFTANEFASIPFDTFDLASSRPIIVNASFFRHFTFTHSFTGIKNGWRDVTQVQSGGPGDSYRPIRTYVRLELWRDGTRQTSRWLTFWQDHSVNVQLHWAPTVWTNRNYTLRALGSCDRSNEFRGIYMDLSFGLR